MIAALLFLLAFSARVEVVNESFEIPANDWRYVPRPVNVEPALVSCDFSSGPRARVSVALLSRSDLDARRAGRDYEEIAASPAGPRGMLRVAVHEPDAYLVIQNHAAESATVHLRVFLEEPQVRYLSRRRQLAVIVISFALFFAIVTLSARKLLKAIKK
jgi:hypothetical protein